MTPAQLEELRHRRAALVTDMRGISDTAETENRNLTAEETQEFERREADFQDLTERIQRAETLDGMEPRMTPAAATGNDDVDPDEVRSGTGTEEYRSAFESFLRSGLGELTDEERTTLNTATDADGGFAVPETWGGLIQPLRDYGIIRTLANVIQTEDGGKIHYPREKDLMSDFAIVGEEQPIPNDGSEFDEVVFDAYKYAKIIKASEEMVQDAIFDVEAYVQDRAGFKLGLSQNADFVNGNGTGKPMGLFAGAVVAKTVASPTTITMDEAIDLQYSVIGPYRANGVYIAADASHASFRKLKDSDGQYLWQPSVQEGQPDRFIGKPIYADPSVHAIAASKRPLGFGDVKQAYTIRDAGGVSIKFLDQTYAENDQVAWKVKLRSDGDITDPNAFKVLATPAS
ncbi:MAG TPA: phage major capsid protein [Solirubrobacterales bacterium]|nr:phage major capsid protein [Solirubrobacterales bacterium]